MVGYLFVSSLAATTLVHLPYLLTSCHLSLSEVAEVETDLALSVLHGWQCQTVGPFSQAERAPKD